MGERTNNLIFHAVVVLFFLIAWRAVLDLGEQLKNTRKTHSRLATRFLTNWNFFIQTVLFSGYLLYDIIELIGFNGQFVKKMKRTIDFHFYGINAPTSIFIAIVFWGMCFYNKLLIFPAGLENLMPEWVNHSLHTAIVVNVIIQAYLNKVSLTNVRQTAISYAAFYLFYFVCIYGTYYETKIWVYPFLGLIDEPYRILFLLGLFLFSVLIHVIFNLSNKWYCDKCLSQSPPIKPQRSTHRKKQK